MSGRKNQCYRVRLSQEALKAEHLIPYLRRAKRILGRLPPFIGVGINWHFDTAKEAKAAAKRLREAECGFTSITLIRG